MAHLWQHPYVNVFKHFNLATWKKSSKEGEVTSLMDKQTKSTVYRITGSIPAGNFIQLPKTTSQSLGLTGRYMYLLFRPIPGKYFVVHVDVATQDGLIVRVSFSNLFKEFKSTSTWLQFPFVCHASKGSIAGYAGMKARDHSGPAPLSTRWTVLCLDFQYILSMYLNRRYSYIKSFKLCANMLVKNVFTSDLDYEPGLTFDQVKKEGLALHGVAPLPREMAFPLGKLEAWHETYDHIRFPSEATKKPFDSVQYTKTSSSPQLNKKAGGVGLISSPRRVASKTLFANRPSSDRQVTTIQTATAPKPMIKRHTVASDLPPVNVTSKGDISIETTDDGEVHVYAHPDEPVYIHQQNTRTGKVTVKKVSAPADIVPKPASYKSLKPDPIIQLRRIVGFGGVSFRDALWVMNGTTVVYPCHGVVVAMQVNNGHQRFFIGHTDKVSCISMNGSSSLLASGQTGSQSVVRVWNFHSAQCLAMFKTHAHTLHCLSFSQNGRVLSGVGKDNHGKNMVVMWNTERVSKGGQVSVIAKAHTDVDIVRMRIAAFDDTRMVSCGRDNVRLWRVKDGALRSAPVNLAEHHTMDFTDCCFEAGHDATKDPLDRLVYVCSRSGHIFEINYGKVIVQHVRRLLPTKKKDKQTFNSGCGIAINSMCVNEAFCATGSDDGFLRLWPLDFKHVYLEAEHEGPVTAVDISSDGVRILAGTSTGNLGVLDVSTRGYTTIMRSHTDRLVCADVDPVRRHLATVAEDHTIRVWDMDTMQQLYDFSAPKECPTTIAYHPSQQVFAVGFESGAVRVFDIVSTTMIAEQKQHRGKVVGLVYSPSGDYLYSAGSLGSVALYDCSSKAYALLRLLGNTLARGESRAPNALAVSPDGSRVAFIGPTEFTVSVTDARTLDEVLRIDITSLNTVDNSRTVIDTAMKVLYTPENVHHLLVTTSSHKLLKFDACTGRILSEVDNIHRGDCTGLNVSADGRHLATAGDRVIKIWDYAMRLDLNFQVFIGHCDKIVNVLFTPDQLGVISFGEAVFIWDFLARTKGLQQMDGRQSVKNLYTGEDEEPNPYHKGIVQKREAWAPDLPRQTVPKPVSYEPGGAISDLSSIHHSQNGELIGDVDSELSDKEEVLIGPSLRDIGDQDGGNYSDVENEAALVNGVRTLGWGAHAHQRHHTPTKQDASASRHRSPNHTPTKAKSPCSKSHKSHSVQVRQPGNKTHQAASPKQSPVKQNGQPRVEHTKPSVLHHFVQRPKTHALAQRRYTAPPNQAGVKLRSVIGYNGNGRDNMIWHADTGVFVYTCGCINVVEDLNKGSQQHLLGHSEEISTLTLSHDCLVLASASGSYGLSSSQICLWDMQQKTCKKVLTYHEHDIISLSFSRDDRFLLSLGDYRECAVVVWSMYNYTVLATTTTTVPMHHIKWDPYTVNEFASVGQNGAILFWLLDETGDTVNLNVHEAEIPDDLLQTHHMGSGQVDFTCMEYAGDSILYVGTSNGKVSAWDTRHNSCFMHWEADTSEIDVLISRGGRLITGGSGRSLRMWSVIGLQELRLPGDNNAVRHGGLSMEDEMNLDGAITAAAFDDTLDMGIVGTQSGTLWYVNWTERASIRLVSGHTNKVNAIALDEDQFFASCSDDGSLRVWSVSDREQTLQFQVIDQSCNCMAFSPTKMQPSSQTTVSNLNATPVVAHVPPEDRIIMPSVAAGYSDGTVRMFDLNRVEMVLKMQPHAVAVTAISFSADGRIILSGGSDGLIAVSNPATGMTVRVINDHKGAPITCIDVTFSREEHDLGVTAPLLWLAASADRRVSVWSADWSKDFCELVDWMSFPAPAFTPDGLAIKKGDQSYYAHVPPSLARFSYEEPDIVIYTGYGMQKQIQFYSLQQRKVVRTLSLTHWATSLDICPSIPLIAVGANERILKLVDYYEGSFQDFVGHSDSLQITRFTSNGQLLFTTAHNELLIWDVCL